MSVASLVAGCTSTTSGTAISGRAVPCQAASAPPIVSCLADSLRRYWTNALGTPIVEDVVVAPTAAAVPASCRYALALGTAFTCGVDQRIFLTSAYVSKLLHTAPTGDAPDRFAATLAHETGHVLQLTEHDPALQVRHRTDVQQRAIEQQADCLSGVWAHGVGYDRTGFLAGARQVLRIVDNAAEERSHGTPTQRLAAIERGMAGGTTQACGLAVR